MYALSHSLTHSRPTNHHNFEENARVFENGIVILNSMCRFRDRELFIQREYVKVSMNGIVSRDIQVTPCNWSLTEKDEIYNFFSDGVLRVCMSVR